MARPKKSETNTTSVVEEEKTTEVENVETPVTEVETTEEKPVVETVQEEKKEPEKPVTNKKPKDFGENEKVIIKYEGLAGKKLSLPTRTVEFDENGKCEVTGAEANRLLTIPGYELAK